MSEFEAMVQHHLGAAQRKQALLEAQAAEKKQYLDPVFEFGVDEVEILDQDTVRLPNGESLRLSAGEGRTLDAYETEASRYADRPETFERHKQNYARAYGLDPDDVTVDDLVIAGQSQKAKAPDRLRSMADENGRIRYRRRGQDDYNRTIAEVDPGQVNLSGRQDNADYYSKFNYEQTLEDFASGERAQQIRGSGDRGLKTGASDQVVNFAAGAGRMANDLVQGAGTLLGINNIPGVDEGHRKVREALDSFKAWGNSPQQQRRERLEQERNELQSEFYNVQREKYLKDGNSELNASIRAGIDEFTNSVGNIIDNPGAILDKTVESLPYMLGVASVGKAATTKALQAVHKNILKNTGVQKNITRGLEKTQGIKGTKGRFQSKADLEATAAFHTQKFINSKPGQAYLKRVQTISGVTTVGLTEGLSTSADVYDSIVNMTEEQAANSETYLALRNDGLSHEKAVQELAEDASFQTFLTVSLAAGAASWVTGAGTFESQLFTGLGRVSKTAAKVAKDAAKEPTKKGAVRTLVSGAYRGAKATAKHLGPGAVKEGAEELLQSGGGEFLSQLASFEATGEQVGPGVGRAAGEGFVVGFASGGLAEATFGSLKKLGSMNAKELASKMSQYKDRVKNDPKVRTAVVANAGAVATGSSTVTATDGTQVDAASASPDVPTPEAVAQLTPEEVSGSFDKALNADHPSIVHHFYALDKIRTRALSQGVELSEKQQKQYELLKGLAQEQIAPVLEDIYAKDEADITAQDKAKLRWAAEQGFNIDTTRLPEGVANEVNAEVQLAQEFEASNETAANIAANTPEGTRTAVQRVHEEKFGDVVTERKGKKYFGLGYYNRRMRELMAVLDPGKQGTEDNSELDSLMRRLKAFKASQNNYLQAVRTAIEKADPALDIPIPGTNKFIKYIAPAPGNNGGTVGLEALLTQEQEQFNQIRQGLINRYNQWSGSAAPVVRNSAAAAANAETQANQQAESQTRKQRRAQLEAESTPEPELRAERAQIRKDTKLGTSERDRALLNLRNRARKTGDKYLVSELDIDLKHNAKIARQERKATKKAKQEAAEAQRPDGAPTLEEDIDAEIGNRRKKQGLNIETAEEASEKPAENTRPAPGTQGLSLRKIAGEGIVAALKHLSQFNESKGNRVIAARVLEVLKKDVEVIFLSNEEMLARFGKKAKGAFVKKDGQRTIYINRDRTKSEMVLGNTLLHEAIHAAIDGYIQDNKISPELKERLRKLNTEVVLALTRRGEPNDIVLAHILAANPEELLTHGIATPYLQNFLRQMKVKDKTLWDKFVDFVADLLGVPKGSALGEVLNVTEAVFQEVQGRAAPVVETVQTAPEADREPGAAAAAEARGEPTAEGNPDLQQLEKEQKQLLRLAEARGLRSRIVNRRATAESAYLTNDEDRAFFERLLQSGVPVIQAIEQLIARIEPNPAARDATLESSIPQEVIEQAIARGSVLNVPGTQEQVKARSFLQNLWDFGADLAVYLKEVLLGQKASDVWRLKSKNVRDLLASEDNIMQILTDTVAREQFFENIGTTPAEERALRNFAAFYQRFSDTLERTMAQEPKDGQSSVTQTAKNPLYYFRDPNTGKLDPNVVGAMALEAMQYLTGSGAATVRNTDDDIRALLGLKDYAPVDPAARSVLGRGTLKANAIMEMGTSIFAHLNIALQEGQRPLQNDVLVAALGAQTLLTLTQLGPTTQDGNVIPRVQQIRVSRLEWNRLKELHTDELDIQADTGLVDDSINADGDIILVTNNLGPQEWDNDLKAWVQTDVNHKLAEHIEEGRAIFEKLFGAVTTIRSPLFGEPTIQNIATHVLRSGTKISKAMRERILHDAKHWYQPDTEVLGLLNKFRDLTDFLKMAHEYKSQEQLNELHDEIRPGEESRNRGLENELKEIVRWGRIYGDRKVYLPQRMTRNGRMIIESNVLNPQTSKIHRFLLKREGWSRTVTKGQLSEDQYRGLMMAIGLGIGLKTDSLMADDVIQRVEAAFTQPGDWRDAMMTLVNAGETFTEDDMKALAKVMGKEGTHTLAALNTAAKYFTAKDGDTLEISLPHETDGVTNGYIIGLLATPPTDPDLINGDYRALLNAGGIYFDGDSWTNLAEYKAAGNLDNYQQIAQMTRDRLIATFRAAKRVEQQTLVDYRNAKSIRDRIPGRDIVIQQNTQMVATSGLVPTGNQLQQMGNENAEEVKVGRQWAKDPLMITSYGAGTGSTVRKVVSNAIETFYKELGKSQNIEELTFNLNRAYQIINMVVQSNNRQNVPRFKGYDQNGRRLYEKWEQLGTDHPSGLMSVEEVQAFVDREFGGSVRKMATEFILTSAARQHLTTGIAVTYGSALAASLDERLSPVKAVRAKMNAAMQFSNEMYVAEYQRQIADIIKEKGVASHADKEQVKDGLRNQGLVPSVATAASSEIDEELEMVSYGHEYMRSGPDQLLEGVGFLENPSQVVHQEYGVNGQVREGSQVKPLRTVTGRIITLTPNSDVGVSAVVKAIHALDGVVNSLIWGRGTVPVVNVHDAQVSPWWAAEQIATNANSAFGQTIVDYNMLQAFLNSMNRIHGSLWEANDTRLSKEVRDKIALKMYAINEAHSIVEGLVRGATPVEQGYSIIDMLVVQMRSTTSASSRNKTGLMSDIRWINQFAQDGTEIGTPKGLLPNTPTEWSKEKPSNPEVLLEEELPDVETQLAEEFDNQFEFEKVESLWEALGEGQTDVDVAHQNHLRDLVSNLVKPGLAGIETLAQNIIEQSGSALDQQMWENFQQFNQATAAGTLSANEDISLQERAAQEYVTMMAYAGIQGDHFVRKELRRLYDLAAENITPASFLAEDTTGDPAIAMQRAQERYDSIFNAANANEGYARFLGIGLTNKRFSEALAAIDNPIVGSTPVVDWNKGILGGMLSLLRQVFQKIAGVGLRYNGGNVQNAIQALAGATVAANQKNLQRLADQRNNVDQTSRVQKWNANIVRAIDERVVTPLSRGLEATHEKRLDPKNPTLPGFIKAATYAALKTRDDDVREHYNRIYREISTPYGFGKDNGVFGTMAEVLPWKTEDLNWIGLLRKSKYIVDMARQEVNDHTRSFLTKSFDPRNHISKAQKIAITNVVLKTDLNSLLDNNNNGLTMGRLAEILVDPNLREVETQRQDVALRQELAKQGLPSRLFFLFQNQARSLGNYMTTGVFTVENPMMNAHNIVQQRMLDGLDQVPVKDAAALEAIVDRMATLHALNITPANDLRLANEIIQHEMAREDVPDDNGFSRLVGMHINFKELAKQKLFNGNPTQMIKGYVYEIFDGDVNVEYVLEGSPREYQLQAEGMTRVGRLPKDPNDGFAGQRVIYKGMRGLNGYNKSIVSLTDLQHRGANLFSTAGWQSQNALQKLGKVRGDAFLGARNQFTPNYSKNSPNMVPVLNEQGKIVDYRYMMSESNKRAILKKEDPFDRVLPHMMASITDRNNTQVINRDVVNLLKAEYDAGKDSPSHRFVRISATAADEASRDMWNLLPEDMKRAATDAFGFPGIYVRDEVANLVLGFRKATISNLTKPGTGNEDRPAELLWGKNTPVVRMAEKVWLEIVQLMRVKIAILTPAVVVGNMASNTAMLLSEGIPLNYIRKNAGEAISAMRQYQKDRQDATELSTRIGSARALGRDTRALEVRLNRLEANLAANPVANLVADGLFTSITADLGVDDDTIRGSLIQKAEDALGNKGGKYGQAAASLAKELYMLPGSKGFKAAIAATQYSDFVGRYVKFKYDTQVNKKDREQAINDALASFIYYDIPQPKYLQALNDSGLVMFTKFFLRIQHVIAHMYSQNPISATSVLLMQKAVLPNPFSENIMNYGLGDGLGNKFNNPLNLPGKAWNTLDPTEPALLQWILNPFGL